MPITRLYTTGLLQAGPLPDCILLVCYQQVHYQTVYHCSAIHMPITSLYTTCLLPTCPLPHCILLFCFQQVHYLTVYYCSATNMPIIRLYSTGLLPKSPLPDCILLVCYQQTHYNGLEIPWGQQKTGKDGKVLSQRHLWCPDDLQD